MTTVLGERQHVMSRMREEVSIDQDGELYELTRFVMRGEMTGLLYDAPAE